MNNANTDGLIDEVKEAYRDLYNDTELLAGWLKVSKLMHGLGIDNSNVGKCLASIGEILSSRPKNVEPVDFLKEQEEKIFALLDAIGAVKEK